MLVRKSLIKCNSHYDLIRGNEVERWEARMSYWKELDEKEAAILRFDDHTDITPREAPRVKPLSIIWPTICLAVAAGTVTLVYAALS
jgi:hypothetical protein